MTLKTHKLTPHNYAMQALKLIRIIPKSLTVPNSTQHRHHLDHQFLRNYFLL